VTLETRQVLLPEPAVFLRPLRYFLNSRGLELVDALPAFLLFMNEARIAKNPQVLRYSRPTHSESWSELVHRRWTFSKSIENRPPRGVRDCAEHVRVSGLTVHDYM